MKSTTTDTVIQLQNISKTYTIYNRSYHIHERIKSLLNRQKKKKLQALKNISFSIKKGEFFGIIGHNGCGKSTLISILNETIPPDPNGTLEINGSTMRLALGMGFNPELTGIQNIMVNASILGLTKKEIKEIIGDILEFSGLEKFKDTPVKYYSSGMKSKLMFAVAIYAKADIFLMDEFFGGVGDKEYKAKAEKVFEERILKGRTIVHVSHNMATIKNYCDRVLLLKNGEMVAIGKPEEVIPQM
jgi:ABC-type polysaccharide/polyol phosphate transport system ATPase subunit